LENGYAKAFGVPLLMANLSQQVYRMGRAPGLNKEDGSAIIKVFEHQTRLISAPICSPMR
jgi:3-hydroxyisobutyrate dehydrogenase-like beta-hydroxyacid dehydrogenase